MEASQVLIPFIEMAFQYDKNRTSLWQSLKLKELNCDAIRQ